MKIIKKQGKKELYTAIKLGNGSCVVCKVLNMYKSRKEALDKMFAVLYAKTTEEKLLNDYLQEE